MDIGFNLETPLESGLQPGDENGRVFDLAILGGGPAGMTAAVYALRKQLGTVMISPELGGQVLVTSGVENYMGYQYITGPELSRKFTEQIRQFHLNLITGEKAITVARKDAEVFVTRTESGREITSRTLILATGKRWRQLNVPGEADYLGRGVAYCAICDAPFFKGRPVVIAGGGNSALTAAVDMLQLGSPVTIINAAGGWQADPVLLERVQGKATLLDQQRILEILGDGQKVTGIRIASLDRGEERVLQTQGVFVEIGLIPNTDLFRGFVDMNEEQEVIVNCASHTSLPGVFAAGDCTNVPEKQIIIAAGDGAKAALAAYKTIAFGRVAA